MRRASEILRLIEPELKEVEVRLKSEAVSNLGMVEEMNSYLHDSGGKRLRPGLLLLTSKLMNGQSSEAAVKLGVVVELVHVATLVHDDIIDNSSVRRGRPSLNAKWGNDVTVLFGDWLYMSAFWIALRLQNFRVLDVLIDLTRKMVEGELIQLERNYKLSSSVEEHLKVCWHKTAYLFAGCGRLGAITSGADREQEENLAAYGEALGMAFQLVDDLLDYTAKESVLGKPVMKDLEEGSVTLPIISLMRQATPAEQAFLQDVVERRDFSAANKDEILKLIRNYGTLEEVRALAGEYAEKARLALAGFPDTPYRDALLELPEVVLTRSN